MTSESCVICQRDAMHGGLCCRHRYDEQPPCSACPDAERSLSPDPTPSDERVQSVLPCRVKGCDAPRAYDRRCNQHGLEHAARLRQGVEVPRR